MIDIILTLSNMLGVKPKYNLGNDMFSIAATKDNNVDKDDFCLNKINLSE